jgi:hypothetical protein
MTTIAPLPRALGAGALLLAFALAHAGCCIGGTETESRYADCWTAKGTGTITTPAAYPLQDNDARVISGRSCLDDDGSCRRGPGFVVDNDNNGDSVATWTVTAAVGLRQAEGPGSYDVVSEDVDVIAHLIDYPVVTRLTPVGGRITVDRSDASRFQASFDMQLATPAGEIITITDATVDISGCKVHVAEVCSAEGSWHE